MIDTCIEMQSCLFFITKKLLSVFFFRLQLARKRYYKNKISQNITRGRTEEVTTDIHTNGNDAESFANFAFHRSCFFDENIQQH